MATSPLYRSPPKPPGIYRTARWLRRISVIVLVVIIVFVAFVVYSAVQITKSHPSVGSSTSQLEANDTVGITSSLTLTNPTYFAIQQFEIQVHILNGSGLSLVDTTVGPTTISAGGSATLPLALYIPITAEGQSLLVQNQNLEWYVWGNASYGYLFSISLGVETNKSWGAPFEGLTLTVGTPTMMGGAYSVPVTLSFNDDASFADSGTLSFQILPASGPSCGSGSFTLDVPPGSPYQQTQSIGVAAGCDPSGGKVTSEFVGDGIDVVLPPESIP
ncbi:MAG TPA: hypothetical protein VMF04_00395 [Thermoplasmata archaeon]|nr:hypothetical protein [Thermoplasmata archaeon]